MPDPLISVVISTKNGREWLPNCFASLRAQTVFDQLEIIVVDNCSTNGTGDLARAELATFPRATVLATTEDRGYSGGNSVGIEAAKGELLFILNDDTRLEPDCLERLLDAMKAANAANAVPAQVELDSMKSVPSTQMGFDIFGRSSWSESDHDLPGSWHYCFMIGGPGFLIRREVWEKIGGFDVAHFAGAEDDETSWKFWLAGYQSIYVKDAILHHRSGRSWEIKELYRYYVNRNSLLVVFKNAQHILLLTGLLQVLMVLAEGVLVWFISRSWKFARNSYFKAVIDCFKMWPHVRKMRKFNRAIRKRSDWWMARKFLRLRINRWDMVKAFFLHGRRPVITTATKYHIAH